MFHEKLVAGGNAILNLPDDGGAILIGWRSDLKALVLSVYPPDGTYQQTQLTKIGKDTMSGTCRGWAAPLELSYTGKVVWSKIDVDSYTVNAELDLGDVKYKASSKFIRRSSGR